MTSALLLCAGRGERLRPLTDTLPKPLVGVGGETLVGRHLRALAAAGVTRVVINLGWLGERIVEHVGDGARYGLRVLYSPEGYPTLDTGGAIVRALPLLDDAPFWVVNADIYTDFGFARGAVALLDGTEAAIGLTPNPNYRDNGDFSQVDNRAHNAGAVMQTFSGIACYAPTFFADCEDGRFSVVPLLRAAADAGALGAFDAGSPWYDVGTPERLATLRAAVAF
ncbi:MAG: nucleotidyltransferase family protein [Pseudomonadota bacterium]